MFNIFINNPTTEIFEFIDYIKGSNLKKLFNFVISASVKNNIEEYVVNEAFDYIYINDENFEDIDEDDFFDLCIELINNKRKIYIKNYDEFIDNEIINETVTDLDLKENIINNSFDIDLKNPNLNTFSAILEIFEVKNFKSVEKRKVFQTKHYEENDGMLTFENNEKVSFTNKSLLVKKLFSHLNPCEENTEEKIFTTAIPEDALLIFENENEEQFVENFKINVYNSLKDLSIDKFLELNPMIKKILIEYEYLPLSDILELIQ